MRRLRRLAHLVLFCPFSKGLQVGAPPPRPRPAPAPVPAPPAVGPGPRRGRAASSLGPGAGSGLEADERCGAWPPGRLGAGRALGTGVRTVHAVSGAAGPRGCCRVAPLPLGLKEAPPCRGLDLLPQAQKPHQVRSASLDLKDQVCFSVMENLGHTEPP